MASFWAEVGDCGTATRNEAQPLTFIFDLQFAFFGRGMRLRHCHRRLRGGCSTMADCCLIEACEFCRSPSSQRRWATMAQPSPSSRRSRPRRRTTTCSSSPHGATCSTLASATSPVSSSSKHRHDASGASDVADFRALECRTACVGAQDTKTHARRHLCRTCISTNAE